MITVIENKETRSTSTWLRSNVARMFGCHLEELHRWPPLGDYSEQPDRDEDQATAAHAQFYRLFPRIAPHVAMFQLLLASVLFPREGTNPKRMAVQAIPNFRVQLPNSRAVGEAHRDGYYGHVPGEVTVWLPLTPYAGPTSTIWVEVPAAHEVDDDAGPGWLPAPPDWRADVPDRIVAAGERAPLCPVPVQLGQALVFDAVRLMHGNRQNRDQLEPERYIDEFGHPQVRRWHGPGHTRVSLDWRYIWRADLEAVEEPALAVNTGQPMTLGEYWRPI